jgi:hypothetical protein|tara:strand:+ start:3295 stop:3543 length:249 start_codon:yes stop_codon:yes gene_type:complete
MTIEAAEARAVLMKEAAKKYNQMVSGSAFATDFSAAEIINQLISEVRILNLENKKYKKIITYNKFYIEEKEKEIKNLREKAG